jgi:predicted aspartyl protease
VLFGVFNTYAQTLTTHSIPTAREIQLFIAPDESSAVIATLNPGDDLSPVADVLNGEGIRWYLVKAKNGAIGWTKRKNNEETEELRKIEKFFKSLPVEPSLPVSTDSPFSGDSGSRTISVPVEMSGTWIVVPVTFNRALRAYLQLDTGASTTLVSSRIAKNLSLRPLGSRRGVTVSGIITVSVARLSSLKVGDAEVNDLVVSIHDFSPHPHVEGLLGMDFLKRFHVSLDARRKLLVLGPR